VHTFFSRISSWFSEGMGGRYLSVILAELLNEDKRVAKVLFPGFRIDRKQSVRAIPEAVFLGKLGKRKRRADIEVRLGGESQSTLVGQIEVKYEDHKLDSVLSQVEDYVTHLRAHGSRTHPLYFTYLTKHQIPRVHQVRLDKHARRRDIHLKRITYHQLYRALHRIKNPTVELFCRHLEEIGMQYKKLEQKDFHALEMFILKSLGAPHAHGFGRKREKASIEQVPVVLRLLFENVQILADRFYAKHRNSFGNRFSIDFGFTPRFSRARLQRQLRKDSDKRLITLPRQNLEDGWYWIGAAGHIRNAPTYLMLGCLFYVDLSDKTLTKWLFAEIYGGGLSLSKEQKFTSLFPSEDVASRRLSILAKKVLHLTADETKGVRIKRRIGALAKAIS
jgi:hypothetical protein